MQTISPTLVSLLTSLVVDTAVDFGGEARAYLVRRYKRKLLDCLAEVIGSGAHGLTAACQPGGRCGLPAALAIVRVKHEQLAGFR